MNGCKYERADPKCYLPNQIDPVDGPDWCVEGPCHLQEPDIMMCQEKKAWLKRYTDLNWTETGQ